MSEDKMRCAIYARYSSDLQNERSIDDQIRNCRKFADQKGWFVLDNYIFTDKAISGASILGRTGLSNLVRISQQHPKPFEYVLIDDTSRLSRKMGEADNIINQFRFREINVFFVSQGIDSKDKQANLSIGVNSLIDSQYRIDLAAKTLRGMSGQALKGFNTGGHVYGYKYTKVLDESGTIDRKTGQVRIRGTLIEIDRETSKVIKGIFSLFNNGLSIRDITNYSTEKGYPPPFAKQQLIKGRKKPTWVPNTIRSILKNPKYIGDWTFNKTGWITNPETGQRRRITKDASEWVINHQPGLAIIDKNTWNLAQQRIDKNRLNSREKIRGHVKRFLFTGLMKCHECNGNYVLVTSSDRPNPKYGCCTNWQRGRATCSNNFKVGKAELETVILTDIQKKLLTPPILSAIVNQTNKLLKEKISKLKAQSHSLFTERKDIGKKLKNIISAIEKGSFSPTLQKRLTEIEQYRQELDSQIELINNKFDYESLKFDETRSMNWLQNIRKLLNINPALARSELIPLIGTFTLSPEMIDGIKYLRIQGNTNIDGLLAIATGRQSPIRRILGGGVEPPTS